MSHELDATGGGTTVNPARLVVVAIEERRSLVNLSLDDFEVGSCTWHGVFWGLIVFSGSEHTEDDLFVSCPVTISYSRPAVDRIGLSGPREVHSETPVMASVRLYCMPMGYSIVGPKRGARAKVTRPVVYRRRRGDVRVPLNRDRLCAGHSKEVGRSRPVQTPTRQGHRQAMFAVALVQRRPVTGSASDA
jgi:hypothetical protein